MTLSSYSHAIADSSEPDKPSNFIYLPSVGFNGFSGPYPELAAPAPDWLNYLNSYRAMALLPPLVEEPAWSSGGQAHSRYTVKNDVLQHTEDAGNPWYSAEGLAAAQSGNLMASHDVNASDHHAIDSWMQAPFHALGILDPALAKVGYGSYREADGGLQMGATLDVLRGLGSIPSNASFPVMWPANGTTTPIGTYTSEYPDPLTSCPGYTAPAGLPVLLQLGAGELSPTVSSYSFSQGGRTLESCVFTETTYSNPDPSAQALARSILAERDAVVLIPRSPLTPGATYSVSITANGAKYSWSFTVASTAP